MSPRRVVSTLIACLTLMAGIPAASSAAAREPRIRLPDPVACPGCYRPALRTSWQWQLQGPVDTSIDVEGSAPDGRHRSQVLEARSPGDATHRG